MIKIIPWGRFLTDREIKKRQTVSLGRFEVKKNDKEKIRDFLGQIRGDKKQIKKKQTVSLGIIEGIKKDEKKITDFSRLC